MLGNAVSCGCNSKYMKLTAFWCRLGSITQTSSKLKRTRLCKLQTEKWFLVLLCLSSGYLNFKVKASCSLNSFKSVVKCMICSVVTFFISIIQPSHPPTVSTAILYLISQTFRNKVFDFCTKTSFNQLQVTQFRFLEKNVPLKKWQIFMEHTI